jgi:hypothetical protein
MRTANDKHMNVLSQTIGSVFLGGVAVACHCNSSFHAPGCQLGSGSWREVGHLQVATALGQDAVREAGPAA